MRKSVWLGSVLTFVGGVAAVVVAVTPTDEDPARIWVARDDKLSEFDVRLEPGGAFLDGWYTPPGFERVSSGCLVFGRVEPTGGASILRVFRETEKTEEVRYVAYEPTGRSVAAEREFKEYELVLGDRRDALLRSAEATGK